MSKETIPIYLASNQKPPAFLIYGNQEDSLSSMITRKLIKELDDWDCTIFAYTTPKEGEHKEFIPLYKEDAHKKIRDYKYIIKHE